MSELDPKLMKIIALARSGIDGERENALKLVKRMCIKYDLEFDDVMNATDEREFELHFKWRNKEEKQIIVQVLFEYAIPDRKTGLTSNDYHKLFHYETTPSRHVEASNAVPIYVQAFRKERKKIINDLSDAFIVKHRLFGFRDEDRDASEITAETLDNARRIMSIAGNMDSITIRKSIGDKQ